MSKFKIHFQNETRDKASDTFIEASDFAEAYERAQERVLQLEVRQGRGWRIVGVYEILYNLEKFSETIH